MTVLDPGTVPPARRAPQATPAPPGALGRRELATLQPFDLILLVVIGDLFIAYAPHSECRLGPVCDSHRHPVRPDPAAVTLP
jgi:hypothetical protein